MPDAVWNGPCGHADATAIDPSDRDLWATGRIETVFEDLRRRSPVHFCADSAFGPYWSVTRHADIQAVEMQPDIFSSSHERGGITIVGGTSPIWGDDRIPMFIAMDRPDHTRERRTVAPAFSPTELQRLAPLIKARTRDGLARFGSDDHFDWHRQIAVSLTAQMLATLLGVPDADQDKLVEWAEWGGHVEALRDPVLGARRAEAMRECAAYFFRLLITRRGQPPGADLLSMLVHAPREEARSPQDLLGNLILLIVGGSDTTRNTMGALAVLARTQPDEVARAIGNPGLWDSAAQELVRWQTPLAHMRRTANCDVTLGDQTIRAGEKVVLWYLSANRDEAVFEDAGRFVADRPNVRAHLAFGHGLHRCVGARLAHLQIRTLLECLHERRLMPVANGVERTSTCFTHGYRALPAQLVTI